MLRISTSFCYILHLFLFIFASILVLKCYIVNILNRKSTKEAEVYVPGKLYSSGLVCVAEMPSFREVTREFASPPMTHNLHH